MCYPIRLDIFAGSKKAEMMEYINIGIRIVNNDNNMERQLKVVEESYDKTIELGKKGGNLYDKLPEYILVLQA